MPSQEAPTTPRKTGGTQYPELEARDSKTTMVTTPQKSKGREGRAEGLHIEPWSQDTPALDCQYDLGVRSWVEPDYGWRPVPLLPRSTLPLGISEITREHVDGGKRGGGHPMR